MCSLLMYREAVCRGVLFVLRSATLLNVAKLSFVFVSMRVIMQLESDHYHPSAYLRARSTIAIMPCLGAMS